jgi:hypothetical protein
VAKPASPETPAAPKADIAPAARPSASHVPTAHVPASLFMAPDDLVTEDAGRISVLGIGSCFLEFMMGPKAGKTDPFAVDFLLVSHVNDFPETPPKDIGCYGCRSRCAW